LAECREKKGESDKHPSRKKRVYEGFFEKKANGRGQGIPRSSSSLRQTFQGGRARTKKSGRALKGIIKDREGTVSQGSGAEEKAGGKKRSAGNAHNAKAQGGIERGGEK